MNTALTSDVGQQQPPAVASSVLLACPFCGSAAKITLDRFLWWKRFYVECTYERCPAMMITGGYDTAEAATKAWNTRQANT